MCYETRKPNWNRGSILQNSINFTKAIMKSLSPCEKSAQFFDPLRITHVFHPREWPTSLTHEFEPYFWPTRMTHEFDLRVWHTSLTHEFDPRVWPTRMTQEFYPQEWPTRTTWSIRISRLSTIRIRSLKSSFLWTNDL